MCRNWTCVGFAFLLSTITIRASAEPPAKPTAAPGATVQKLFDGRTLAGWHNSEFGGHGEPEVRDGQIILPSGIALSGITYDGKLPTMPYEISLDAKRVDGSDFFCGVTFPVGDAPCSFIVGGWGGGTVGLSSLDGEDAAHNETTSHRGFKTGKWYHVRVRVEADRIQAWIDEERVVDAHTAGKKISIRPEIERSKPLGIASYATTAAIKNIELRERKK